MTELLPLLKQLISAPGLSGHEASIRKPIAEAWRPLVDELTVSPLGSLHGLKRGSQTGTERHSLLLAAHMDAIGLMVTTIAEGFLRVTSVGGLDPRVLPGQLVTVHGREDLPGVIVQPPAHTLPSDPGDKPVGIPHLLVDVGLEPKEVRKLVRPGDPVSFAQEPVELGNELLVGHSLDNRASVAAVTACLQHLQGRSTVWDVWAVATAQEEETLGGAATSAYQLRPTLAVAIDVTFADAPGSPSHQTHPMGKGVPLSWGPNIHPVLYKEFKELAKELEIPHKLEAAPRHTGTDAIALQVAAEGIPTMVLNIPLRYMHTPVEMISMKDVARAGRLMAEFAVRLDDKFMDKLAWEES